MQRLSGSPAGSCNRSAWGCKSPVKLASASKPFHYTSVTIPISLPSRPPSSSIKGIYIYLIIATRSQDSYSLLTSQWPTKARTASSSRTTTTARPLPSKAKAASNPLQKSLPPRNHPAVPSPVLLPSPLFSPPPSAPHSTNPTLQASPPPPVPLATPSARRWNPSCRPSASRLARDYPP